MFSESYIMELHPIFPHSLAAPTALATQKDTYNCSVHSFQASNPKRTWNCLQDVLKDRAGSSESGNLLLYKLGDVSSPKAVSYQDLYAHARASSAKIRCLPRFEECQPVLLHLDDHLETITWFWSILLANGIPVLSSPLSNENDQRRSHLAGLSSTLESPICITRASFLHLFDGHHTLHMVTIETLDKMNHQAGNRMNCPVYRRDHSLAMLMLTSGSTGNSKAVCLSHRQVLSAVAGKASVRSLPPHRPFLNWIGLDHVASLVEIHIQALWLGVDQVHVHAADVVSSPTVFLELLDRHNVSRSFAPNMFLSRLVYALQKTPEYAKWDLSNLTVLASGGEANDVDICAAASDLLHNYGARQDVITPGFGMTETCAGSIFNLHCPTYDVNNGRIIASLGTCMKGIEMRVTVNTGETSSKIAPCDEPGDLELRGEIVFEGYYRNPQANAEAFTPDGWFRTGDRASIDKLGNLNLLGRTNDVINVSGVKILSADIQRSLNQAVGNRVAQLVVFPSRAAHTEQITVAYVPGKCSDGVKDLVEIDNLIVQTCMMSCASYPLVFSLEEKALPLLPRTSLGKISRTKLRSLYESGVFSMDTCSHFSRTKEFKKSDRHLAEDDKVISDEVYLLDDFAKTRGIESSTVMGVHTSLFELGFTSMDLVRLKHRIDHRLNTDVPLIKILKHSTARSLANALNTPGHSNHAIPARSPSAADYDPVVCFRSAGSRVPLWLVHPGVGEVLVFVGLAQHLATDERPVYALRASGFEVGQTRFTTINETVETYVAAIRGRQPHGPYAIAGYSYGAMLAFEIAKRLTALDGPGTVQFLGTFNLPPHIKSRMRQLNWNMCLLHLAYFLGLTSEKHAQSLEQEFRLITRDLALAYVLDIADESRVKELGLDGLALGRWADVAYGLQSMAVDYEPEGMVDVIDVFHATPLKVAAASREEWLREHLSCWRHFCLTKPRYHEVGGAHYTMLGPDHVEGFSTQLKGALKARGV